MTYSIGIDVGGTFTDLLWMDSKSKKQMINKTPTIVNDPSIGVMNGLTEIAEKLSISVAELLSKTDLVVHGTTVTTNAVLTNNGANTALITTKGFRDILHMRRGVRSRENLFNNKYVAPPALVPRELRLTIDERVNKNGEVLKSVDKEEMQSIIQTLKDNNVESVAISFMHSYSNLENERIVREMIEEQLPNVFITTSTEVAPIIRLYNRTSTAVMNAYAGPILKKYITSLVDKLETNQFSGNLLIMQSNGGVTNAEISKKITGDYIIIGSSCGSSCWREHLQKRVGMKMHL